MMSPERWAQARHLFHACLDMPASERVAFLEGQCPDDSEMKAEILSLLQAWQRDRATQDESFQAFTARLPDEALSALCDHDLEAAL